MIRGVSGGAAGRPVAQQIGDAAGNGRRRIEPIDRPGRVRLEALGQQRIMRAGQHHGVGAPAVGVDEAARRFPL